MIVNVVLVKENIFLLENDIYLPMNIKNDKEKIVFVDHVAD